MAAELVTARYRLASRGVTDEVRNVTEHAQSSFRGFRPELLSGISSGLAERFRKNPASVVLIAGLAIMYIPTFVRLLMEGAWTSAENGHGPLIFVVSMWLICSRCRERFPIEIDKPAAKLGWISLLTACLFYIPGRALRLEYFEAGSFIWATTGVVLFTGGTVLLRHLTFPLAFMLFMVPLPNFLVGGLTHLSQEMVSTASVKILGLLDYSVGQNGVVITVGQYQLLVAEACAGTHTLLMLEALGVLYLNLIRHASVLRNVALPLLIVPISFFSNTLRVVLLALITFHFGDEAGQGYVHGFAGIVLFLIGLLLMVLTDSFLRSVAFTAPVAK